jgi:hypothetical protein
MTRAQRAELPLSTDVAQAVAEHGVCIRPPAMRPDTAGRVRCTNLARGGWTLSLESATA